MLVVNGPFSRAFEDTSVLTMCEDHCYMNWYAILMC